MFTELMPLLRKRRLLLTIARLEQSFTIAIFIPWKRLRMPSISPEETLEVPRAHDGVARLCVMNLYPIRGGTDSLQQKPSVAFDMVLTNPPFGKKSSFTIVNEEGEAAKADIAYVRDDFWATTSNKQLNFLQHVKSCLKITAGPRSWYLTTYCLRAVPAKPFAANC